MKMTFNVVIDLPEGTVLGPAVDQLFFSREIGAFVQQLTKFYTAGPGVSVLMETTLNGLTDAEADAAIESANEALKKL
jgi:hypothetical protein